MITPENQIKQITTQEEFIKVYETVESKSDVALFTFLKSIEIENN